MRGWNLDPGRKRLDVSPVITGGQAGCGHKKIQSLVRACNAALNAFSLLGKWEARSSGENWGG